MNESKYINEVREHYESLPYPGRDPADEKKRLLKTSLDFLPRINHYGFEGKYNFSKPFNVLVAGGGTGDAVIYLAEQLCHNKKATITYIDISTASIEIAKERAKIRNLNNINWLHGSLLELNKEQFGVFNYINCSGVLHHLEDPLAGLMALKSVLSDDGIMGIMVYAQYGRTGVYQMQELMRYVNGTDISMHEKIEDTRHVLQALPDTNWFKRAEELHPDHNRYGDIGIYDLFLHAQDRAYTVPELFEWVDQAGLKFISFANGSLNYDPRCYIQDQYLLKSILQKPREIQYAITELLSGNIKKHAFYCGFNNTAAASISGKMYPTFSDESLRNDILDNMGQEYYGDNYIVRKNNIKITIPVNEFTHTIFSYADGRYCFNEIVNLVVEKLALQQGDVQEISQQLFSLFQLLIDIDEIYLSEINLGD